MPERIRGGGRTLPGKTVGRLRRKQDFDRLFAAGRMVMSSFFVLRFVRSSQSPGCARIGIAVGRRLGSAVLRNRLRRRWREIVRMGPMIEPGWDLVVVVRAGSRFAPLSVLRDRWVMVLERSGLTVAAGAGGGVGE
jgi:ribonuclease P protein component